MQDDMMKAIAADLGISDLAAAEQEQLIAQFGEVALQAATIAVLGKMPEEKREEFAKLSEAGDPAALRTFLDATVPDHEAVAKAAVADEVKRFKEFRQS